MASSRPSEFTLTSPGPLRLYSLGELLRLPPPSWLIKHVITQGGLAGLYGPPGEYKTFVAMDMAMCVATGTPWHGHKVTKQHVVYIAAEGGTGIGLRALGWLQEHGIDQKDADIVVLTESMPVAVDSENMDTFFGRVNNEINRTPGLIIIDTLARCLDGNENEQEDMGRFIGGVDRFRREFGATVLVVHHTRLDADRERGSTVFRGAADAMISVRKQGNGHVLVSCNKQKDFEEFKDHEFDIRVQLLPIEDEDHDQLSTIVLVEPALERDEMILQWLTETGGLGFSGLKARALRAQVSPAALKRRLVSLVKNGKIIKENSIYTVVEGSPEK